MDAVAEQSEQAGEQEAVRGKPIRGRKNGLYAWLSEELEQNMRSGWADTWAPCSQPTTQYSTVTCSWARTSAAPRESSP